MSISSPANSLSISSIRLWNSEIRQLVHQNDFKGSLLRFRFMKRDGVQPNNLTFPLVLKSCAKLSNLPFSQVIHGHAVKFPFYYDVYVQTTLVDMYIKCDRMDMASNAFNGMSARDITTWNAMLMGFAQSGLFDGVRSIFNDMKFSAIIPDCVTVIALSQASACINDLELSRSVHSLGICIGADTDISVINTWISAYAKCGDIGAAESLFNSLTLGSRSVVSWNSLIAGYARLKKIPNAMNSYQLMIRNGFLPDSGTIVGLLSSLTEPELLLYGMLVHCHGIKLGCVCSVSVANTLLSMYCNCGEIDLARCLFDQMPEKSQVSWTVMISGYAEVGDVNEALNMFQLMREQPDSVTVLSLISGCAKTGAIEIGKSIHSFAKCKGFDGNVEVCNGLIDMYSKCGMISEAWQVFSSMKHKTVVSWTTMVNGCALNCLYNEALVLFNGMMELGLEPNHITFLAVLQACSHAGLLDSGEKFFTMMYEIYGIVPGLDHYSCMVDLLGRKGKLYEAVNLICNMPIKPDAAIWSSLLSASKIHRNTDIGMYAASHLLKLDQSEAAPFVEMANLYASEGKWHEFGNVRTAMRRKGLRKFPGRSMIEINRKTHSFTSADRNHYEAESLYKALSWMDLQTRPEYHS